ncbi:unnamed protein product [Aureobasidium pullulans]|nr:unnamed protein product [Aureobasidium pullulans]
MAPPLVLVMLGIKDFEVDVDELDFVEGMLDDTFDEEGELAIFDEELLLEEVEETLPRVAVIELFVLEVLAVEVLAVAELFTDDDVFLLLVVDALVDDVFLLVVLDDLADDFTEDEVVLTADDLVLDVLVAELRMHLQAFVT